MTVSETAAGWTPADAAALYDVESWGQGYFAVNAAGHVAVRPDGTAEREIDLYEVVDGLRERGLSPPIMLRFSDILAHRIAHLRRAFAAAIAENDYRGRYLAVYPVKVNQQRSVVEEVYRYGAEHGFGLEVGSKPELLAVMALAGDPERPVICNGFKDDGYIEAVILATKLGRPIIPVVENFVELELILRHAHRYDVRPRLGVRVKLAAQGAGRWRESSGVRSKFGLFTNEVLELLEVLAGEGMADCLELVHCHPGSQVQDIREIKDAIKELASVYVELARLGAGVRYLDVGGGLGVDYLGARADTASSMNYTLEEYAADIVYAVANACGEAGIEHPVLVSESGRAMVAHHSLLVFEVLGSTGVRRLEVQETLREVEEREDEIPQPIYDLFDARTSLSPERLLESFHDAQQARNEAVQLFRLGYMSLYLRGLADRLFWGLCAEARRLAATLESRPDELAELDVILSDLYFCNLSVFQSIPDAWAVGQLFPVMPIHRLGERPTVQAVLADITCDSDGRIDRFVGRGGEVRPTLDVHALRDGEPYHLAAFLVGAYQETLGDLHNLFGDTHVVHIRLDDQGAWWIDEVVRGDTSAEVLRYVGYDVERLQPRLARDCERAVRAGRMSVAESRSLLRFYEEELAGYTYLE